MDDKIQWDFMFRIFHNIILITLCATIIVMIFISWWGILKFKNAKNDTRKKRKIDN